MPKFLQSMFGRRQVMRRRRRSHRELRATFDLLNDHTLKDIGLRRSRSAGDRWL
ncbi:hypothetical protein CN311_02190 [Mesorhizobium sanjuanii]|uniref:DUF1127 domain-containing protein n=1 Tax=Mesorhizobium sanjuanii TaxID=2037900 RepID=A0A2A6FLD1_9HYPH|nr:DUF1127 domain-containing protein [Mesorhizobium sanjuanii]PDQ22770.1 hypothetical protein CN311_02190 [Mesorhizobium sanjuanii]